MQPATKKMLLTFLAVTAGGLSQTPGVPPMAQQLAASLAGFLMGWAHMAQPGAPS